MNDCLRMVANMKALTNCRSRIKDLFRKFHPPLLTSDESVDPQELILTFHRGKRRGARFLGDYTMCPGVTCPCAVIQFYFYPYSPTPPASESDPPYSFGIDLYEKAISDPDHNIKTPEQEDFAKCFLRGLTRSDWDLLRELHFDFKNYMTETGDPLDMDVEFPPEIQKEPSLNVGYTEILPFGDEIHLDARGRHYVVDDQYCVNPDCDCSEASLDFFRRRGWRGRKAAAAASVLLDYRDESYREEILEEVMGTPTRDPSPAFLLKALLEKHPVSTWRARHEKLKALYRCFRKKRSNVAVTSRSDKVGRNEPCPCGSGKKYKKCCGQS